MASVRIVLSAKNSACLKVLGRGTAVLRVWNGTSWMNARLENALHVQYLSKNLSSLTAAKARGMTIEIAGNECIVRKGDNPLRKAHGVLCFFYSMLKRNPSATW
uniref:Uncharacterized protein n=1 Tax=Peronospora matthiolae TaxID=2874970 RepID=A0AAV1THA0_9STRA